MTVGETLTEARNQAGLSVDELSERTRIRGTVIRSIEEDDYAACGGDLYVRGYVRAIAGAVGIDAQPLIREFEGRSGGPGERANGSTGRPALGYPSPAPQEIAPTSFDLPAITETLPAQEEPAPAGDLNTTRFDMPVVAADPAATSFDLPRVPESPTAAFPAAEPAVAESPTAAFPAPVPLAAPPPPAAVPPGTADTRYDLTAIPADPTQVSPQDLVAAGYHLGPTGAPADTASATQVIPALGFDPTPAEATAAWSAAEPTAPWAAQEGTTPRPLLEPGDPGQAGPPPTDTAPGGGARNKRRGLFAVVAGVVVVAAAGVGIYLAMGSTGTTSTTASGPSTSAAAKSSAAAQASESAAARAQASAAAQASASAAAKASASASAKPPAAPVVSLPVASAMAFGPGGVADGDDSSDAGNVIAAGSSQPWQTQWYSTPNFGMLKHGTGLLLDLGSNVTVTTVTINLSQFAGTDLELRVGNSESLQNLTVAATANNVSGATKLTLQHPVAARYLLIWITQLPPDGQGHYKETISHVAVAGHR